MKIKPFKVEQWMNEYEMDAIYNIAETCVDSITLNELLELSNVDNDDFMKELLNIKMTYGHITGNPKFKAEISKLYNDINSDNIVTTNGGIGANNLVIQTIVESGDGVVSVIPTYQQLYSIPDSIGANVKISFLKKENDFLPDIEELKNMIDSSTKLICLNNPNNPTGTLIPENILLQIVKLAEEVGSYILCDEAYRGLSQDGSYQKSIVDIYDKGISTSSMSKVFSLAGLRLGWIASKDSILMDSINAHRDYSIISCGIIDEVFATLALENSERLLDRNMKIINKNLQILDEWIKIHPHFSYVKPKAGTTALVFYDYNINSEDFCKGLMEHSKTFLTPGSCFEYENSFRLGYANSEDILIKGLQNLEDYCKLFQ